MTEAAKNCQKGLSDPVKLTAFRLRAANKSWQEVADAVCASMTTVRGWSKTPEWHEEIELYVHDVRAQIRVLGSSAAEKAIGALLTLLDSVDEEVRLKAAGMVLDWFNKSTLSAPPVTTKAEPISDAEASKAITSAATLPDLPDAVER